MKFYRERERERELEIADVRNKTCTTCDIGNY